MACSRTFVTVLLLLVTVVWQRDVTEAECVSRRCFCFPEGEVECADLFLRRIPTFQKQSADNATTYRYIDLSINRIRTIRKKAFRNIRVREIRIWSNSGSLNISHRAFRGLENVIEVISIRSVFLRLPVDIAP